MKPINLLLIDNNKESGKALESMISSIGGELKHMQTSEDALKLLNTDYKPDAIVLSQNIPGPIDSMNLYNRLRMLSKLLETPVIFVPSQEGNQPEIQYQKFAEYIKSYNVNNIVEALGKAAPGLEKILETIRPLIISANKDAGKDASVNADKKYWDRLSETQKKALICRETIYHSNFSVLEKAISGSDFVNYLHFVFDSPEEGLGALASLKYFEDQNEIVLNAKNIPEKIIIEIKPTLELPKEEDKKRGIAAYLHTRKDKI